MLGISVEHFILLACFVYVCAVRAFASLIQINKTNDPKDKNDVDENNENATNSHSLIHSLTHKHSPNCCNHKWKIHYNIAVSVSRSCTIHLTPFPTVTIRSFASESYFIKDKFVDFWLCQLSCTFCAVLFQQIYQREREGKRRRIRGIRRSRSGTGGAKDRTKSHHPASISYQIHGIAACNITQQLLSEWNKFSFSFLLLCSDLGVFWSKFSIKSKMNAIAMELSDSDDKMNESNVSKRANERATSKVF